MNETDCISAEQNSAATGRLELGVSALDLALARRSSAGAGDPTTSPAFNSGSPASWFVPGESRQRS